MFNWFEYFHMTNTSNVEWIKISKVPQNDWFLVSCKMYAKFMHVMNIFILHLPSLFFRNVLKQERRLFQIHQYHYTTHVAISLLLFCNHNISVWYCRYNKYFRCCPVNVQQNCHFFCCIDILISKRVLQIFIMIS